MNIKTILQQIALSKQRNDGVNDGAKSKSDGVNDGVIYVKSNDLSQSTINQLIQIGYVVKHFEYEYTQISSYNAI